MSDKKDIEIIDKALSKCVPVMQKVVDIARDKSQIAHEFALSDFLLLKEAFNALARVKGELYTKEVKGE